MVVATPHRLITQVSSIRLALSEAGILLTDMSRAGSLEQGLADNADLEHASERITLPGPVEIVRIEGPIRARVVPKTVPASSRFRYFLDGSQKSIPVCRINLDPVVVALSAAGVLTRDDLGQPRLLGETLRVNQAWIIPQESTNSATRSLVREVLAAGGTVHDPCRPSDGATPEYGTGDYARTLRQAFDLAGHLRSLEERALIEDWTARLSPLDPDAWLVIDGPLRGNAPHAVGLVKSLQTQLLVEDEAVNLFDLPPGQRTTAFRYAHADSEGDGTGKTMWYMRLWPATGMDARHSLVRIEAASDVVTTDQIDEVSAWILAERLPRATDDPRWPALLYPIHYLERILKRRLAAMTTGWPSA
jgi:hypothetical protein